MSDTHRGAPHPMCLFSRNFVPACMRRTGAITAVELRERFVGIFSAGGSEMCEELFKEMAMLVPHPMRKVQLLQLCPNVSAGGQAWARVGQGVEAEGGNGSNGVGRGARAQH